MKLLTKKSAQPHQVSDAALPFAPARRARRARRTLLISLAVLVVLALGSGGYLLFRSRVQPLALPKIPVHLTAADLGLANWREYQMPLPANPLSDPRLPGTPQVNPTLALLEDAAGQALIQQGQLDRGLAYLRAAAQASIDNLRYSNDYRLALRDHRLFAQESRYFLPVAQHDPSPNALINEALVYVDQMRACPLPPDGLVCQAQNSWNSINILGKVIAGHPYNVIARFARGLNNLYWPSLMGHLPQSQEDLQYSAALTRPLSTITQAFTTDAYVALGDVFAKDGKVDQARNVWLNGQNLVPNSSLLSARLRIPQNQLVSEENNQLRGLGVYVDTDLAIFWKLGR
jgi:tetratricopeptide (TPR) repeat protein